METKNLRFGQEIENHFDSSSYLTYYQSPECEPGIAAFMMPNFHRFWSDFGGRKNNLTMLEFGGGPTIHTLISACPFAKEIIFAEYTAGNRKQVEAWQKKEHPFHDWTPFFKHVVQKLEGKSEAEAINREKELRKKITCIIPCDIRTKDVVAVKNIPSVAGEMKFDVVSTTLAICTGVKSDEEFCEAVGKLASLLKPGGHLIMAGILYATFYKVAEEHFFVHPLNESLIRQALDKAGVNNVQFLSHKKDEVYIFFFVSGVVN